MPTPRASTSTQVFTLVSIIFTAVVLARPRPAHRYPKCRSYSEGLGSGPRVYTRDGSKPRRRGSSSSLASDSRRVVGGPRRQYRIPFLLLTTPVSDLSYAHTHGTHIPNLSQHGRVVATI